jgi:hypothetical protein
MNCRLSGAEGYERGRDYRRNGAFGLFANPIRFRWPEPLFHHENAMGYSFHAMLGHDLFFL